jgi:carboxylesterase type B
MFFRKKNKSKLWADKYDEYAAHHVNPNSTLNKQLSQNLYAELQCLYLLGLDSILFMGQYDDMRNFARANILRANMNCVVSDPEGTMFHETEEQLKAAGYHVQLINVAEADAAAILAYQEQKQAIFIYYTQDQQILLQNFYAQITQNATKYAQQKSTSMMLVPNIPVPNCVHNWIAMHKHNMHLIFYTPDYQTFMNQYSAKTMDTLLASCPIRIFTGTHNERTMRWISRMFQDARESRDAHERWVKRQQKQKKPQQTIYVDWPIDRPPPPKPPLVMLPCPQEDECYVYVVACRPMRDKKLT